MKNYNIKNYVRYKKDVSCPSENLEDKMWNEYTRDELVIKFLPLVENIARKFSTLSQACGILTINDLIQEGNIGLILACDKVDWPTIFNCEEPEKRLKSFLSKRIRGSIRRAIDINRGNMRIPEYKLNEMRQNFGKDKEIVKTFFNQVFVSIDENFNNEEENKTFQIIDDHEPYNIDLLNTYLLSIMRQYLTEREYDVIRLSYGLDCNKHSAKDIAAKLKIDGASNYVRVSEIKKLGINKLIERVPPNQVIDYL